MGLFLHTSPLLTRHLLPVRHTMASLIKAGRLHSSNEDLLSCKKAVCKLVWNLEVEAPIACLEAGLVKCASAAEFTTAGARARDRSKPCEEEEQAKWSWRAAWGSERHERKKEYEKLRNQRRARVLAGRAQAAQGRGGGGSFRGPPALCTR